MSYDVLFYPQDAQPVLEVMDEKSQRIVRDTLNGLTDDPYPRQDAGSGDREQITDIDDAHERYG